MTMKSRYGGFAYPVPGSERPGWTPIYRSYGGAPSLGATDPVTGRSAETSFENFLNAVQCYADRPAFGTRRRLADGTFGDYEWIVYREAGELALSFGSGLRLGEWCPPHRDDPELAGSNGILGFYSKNRVEWVLGEQGGFSQNILSVPLYDTLGAEAVSYVVAQTSMETLFCSSAELPNVLKVKEQCPTLSGCICMDENIDEKVRSEFQAAGLRIATFMEVVEAGRKNPQPLSPPKPKDLLTICYTSGTTGDPKGAMLTHRNLLSDLGAIRWTGFDPCTEDVHLSYLPLAHIFERLVMAGIVSAGAQIGFYQGDTLKIVEDLQALRPTIFPSVPRLYNRIYDKLIAGVEEQGGIKKKLFEMGLAAKKAKMESGGGLHHGLWDKLVFSKVKGKVGLDRVRLMVTGSAPISDTVLSFLRLVFSCPVVEGYGQTESSGGTTLTWIDDHAAGTVGPPAHANEISLQDVADMKYLSTDTEHGTGKAAMPCKGRGEVCFRGPNVFLGYYKMPEKTAEAIDSDGWLHSGDIGLWTEDGRLKIVDRKKNIFKLAQGEYVAAEKIENVNLQSALVMQNFVHGDSLKTFLVSIVVVDPDASAAWANKNGKKGMSLEELVKLPELKQAVMTDIQSLAKQHKLLGFEVVKNVHLEHEQWTPESVLTPTFKLRRKDCQDKYQPVLDRLYEEAEKAAPPQSKL